MTNLLETFATITHRDFGWPYSKPIIVKPAQPPMNTGTRLYLSRIEPEDCKCDSHGFQNDKNRTVYVILFLLNR
ncbi:hypothetical protein KM043_003720 [Ampulex compressa]|nr:hypothetical protein KM043_003720 [Ampulex compressa]